jgi:2-haloacid dehalogenase
MSSSINTIIFDLGGVLIDWNPRYLYRKLFKTEEEIDWFLANVCTSEWNDQQDAGRSFDEATQELVKKHPELTEPIEAWYGRWTETINGPISDTVEVLKEIRDSGNYKLYALTNWSDQTFPWAYANFDFLKWFEGIVVSGTEKTRKPFPEFYNILLERYGVNPAKAIFIDDNHKNVEGARTVGISSIHFQNAAQLRDELKLRGVL